MIVIEPVIVAALGNGNDRVAVADTLDDHGSMSELLEVQHFPRHRTLPTGGCGPSTVSNTATRSFPFPSAATITNFDHAHDHGHGSLRPGPGLRPRRSILDD